MKKPRSVVLAVNEQVMILQQLAKSSYSAITQHKIWCQGEDPSCYCIPILHILPSFQYLLGIERQR